MSEDQKSNGSGIEPESPHEETAPAPEDERAPSEERPPKLAGLKRGSGARQRKLAKPSPTPAITPEQRLMLLDTWEAERPAGW